MSDSLRIKTESLSNLTKSTFGKWEHLAKSTGLNYSLFPDWTEVTAKSHGEFEDCEVVTVQKDGNLVALFPMVFTQQRIFGLSLKTLELVSNRISYHNSLISNLPAPESLELLFSIARREKADVIHLADLADSSSIGMHLSDDRLHRYCSAHQMPGATSPYLPLDKEWDDLIASKPKKFRYKLRKRNEELESSEKLEMKWFTHPQDVDELLNAMQIIEGNSWKQVAGISIFDRENEEDYHRMLLPLLFSKDAMYANVLFFDDFPIAYNLCCVFNGWVGQMKTSFDSNYSALSPGSIVIDNAIRRAIEIGAVEFDFLGDADRHKLAWTKFSRQHTGHYLYLKSSWKGRLIGALKRTKHWFSRSG